MTPKTGDGRKKRFSISAKTRSSIRKGTSRRAGSAGASVLQCCADMG